MSGLSLLSARYQVPALWDDQHVRSTDAEACRMNLMTAYAP